MILGNIPSLAAVVPTTMHAQHSLQEHRQKDHVHADERRPEVHLAPELAHGSTGGLGKPIIDPGEQTEDRPGCDDVMEMGDDVISVVQIEIGAVEGEWNAGKTADAKHRQKRGGK